MNMADELKKDNDGDIPTSDKKFMIFWGTNFACSKNGEAIDIPTRQVEDFTFFSEEDGYDDLDREYINEIAVGECYKSTENPISQSSPYPEHSIVRIK